MTDFHRKATDLYADNLNLYRASFNSLRTDADKRRYAMNTHSENLNLYRAPFNL